MNDLETRLSEALHRDTAWRSVDALLDDVRRGVRRRRVRRTTGLVAAAVLVLAGAVGVVLHGSGRTDVAGRTGQGPVGTTGVAVTGSGQVFKVVSGVGCPQLCSTIWRQDGSRWTRLAEFHDSYGGLAGPVIRSLVMAPDGRNGWAWGKALYATHDGGRTWAWVSSVPYQPYTLLDVEVGPTQVWVTSQTDAQGTTLWHAAVGSDHWTRVQPPKVTIPPGVRVAPKHWFIQDVLPDGRVVLMLGPFPHHVYYTIGDEHGWTRQPQRCAPIPPLLGGRVQDHRVCGPTGPYDGRSGRIVPLRYSFVQVAVHPGTTSAPVGDADFLYVAHDRAVIATHSGIVASDLRLGGDDWIVASSESGDHVAILTRGHRIFASNDNGRHWTQVR